MTKEQLTNFLLKHKMSYEHLAELIGLTAPAVYHWLHGTRSIAKPYGRLLRLFDKHPHLMKEFM
jgi:predicted transcriptional regulator